MGLFSINKIPIEDGKVAFNDDQMSQLKDKFGDEKAQQIIDAMNKEIEQVNAAENQNEALEAANRELEEVRAEVNAMLDESNLSDDEKQTLLQNKDGGGDAQLSAQMKELKSMLKKRDEMISKLMSDPEPDSPEAIISKPMKNLQHSATHLFGSTKAYDAFENRGWNQRLRDLSVKATDFNEKGVIPLLQDDVEHFVRENPTALESMFNDFEDLPKEWDRRSGVLDRVASATIIAGEIVQGRKKGWAPKNKFKITPEEGRVFRKKIDITFDGYELQEIENTWIRNYNKSGSHPWKMSFIGFLLSELVKQQKLDDRRAQINGIFAQTPEGDGIAGAAVNSQDGLRYLWHYYRDVKKQYRAFNLGEPTKANILDYIKTMIELIPEEYRNQSGMEIQLSSEILGWYREKAGAVYQLHMSENEGRMEYKRDYPIDYPNFKFQELKDQTKTKFIGITSSKNVQIMDYNVSEKGKFTITHEKRDTHIFVDYRLGIRFKFVGTKLSAGEPANFERQVVWSNDVPVFDAGVSVPVFDDKTGILKVHYPHMKVDEAWVTDITEVEGATPGTVVRITGNTSMAGAKNVTSAGNLDLASNFDLSSGGTLTLYANADGTLKELKRTTEPENTNDTVNEFSGASLDATSGNEFHFIGDENTVLAEIVGGADGKLIKIYGVAGAVTLTLNNVAGNIALTGQAVLSTENDSISLVRVDGVWTEVSRTIA
jgi:hypothetical protein